MSLGWDSKAAWWAGMVLLLVLGTAWIAFSQVPDDVAADYNDSSSLPLEGFAAPDFTLEMLDGPETTLSDLRGQVVLINFWATWCPPCRAEMPAIQEVYNRYRDQGFVVLAVDLGESDARVRGFVEEMELTFSILMDRNEDVSQLYRVRSIPTTYFVDREGVIQDIVIGGPMPRALIESQVTALLAQQGDK